VRVAASVMEPKNSARKTGEQDFVRLQLPVLDMECHVTLLSRNCSIYWDMFGGGTMMVRLARSCSAATAAVRDSFSRQRFF
jgi:hypothetical protein